MSKKYDFTGTLRNLLLLGGAAVLLKKRTGKLSGCEVKGVIDIHAAGELYIYIKNTREVYFEGFIPTAKSLASKMSKGRYDSSKALKAAMNLVDFAAKKYNHDFGSGTYSLQLFNKATREQAAKDILPELVDYASELAEDPTIGATAKSIERAYPEVNENYDLNKDFSELFPSEIIDLDNLRKKYGYSGRNALGRSEARQFWYRLQDYHRNLI